MKRILALALGAIMILTACGSNPGNGDAPTADDGKVYELKIAGTDAEGLPATDAMYWISEEVEKRTDGKVKIKVYPSNQLGEANLQYEGIMDGSIDMILGYLNPTYDKVFDVTSIPFLASNYDEIGYICSEQSNCYQMFKEHCATTNMHFMGFFLNGVNGIFSTKSLGDYLDINVKKDCLIRIANSVTYSLGIQALGYPTITIPWPDTYTSMQTGVMDGMTGIPSYMVEQNFGDLAKYYVAMDMYVEMNCILMSPSTRDKLPAEYVETIEQVCAEVSANSINGTKEDVDAGIEALAARGVEILPITDEERAEVAAQVREKIAPDLKDYFGEEVLNLIYEDIENASKA